MQSESTETSQNTSETNCDTEKYQTNQYGFDNIRKGTSHAFPQAFEDHERTALANETVATRSDASTTSGQPRQRLKSGVHLERTPLTDQISEPEDVIAYTTSIKKQNLPQPSIYDRHLKHSGSNSPLSDFPNEVLTHILSHLPPPALSAVSLVSHQFHDLVTTPHAWRIAFARFFPGSDSRTQLLDVYDSVGDNGTGIEAEKRVFTRLTPLASWRSEYILRTRMLKSLARGKPSEPQEQDSSRQSRAHFGHTGSAQITYHSNLFTTITHLVAMFDHGLKKRPRFIHGADDVGMACSSDPSISKVDHWGFTDAQTFLQFSDRFPGEIEYGLGSGDTIGVPNSMDLSQPFGMVYAEGFPGGRVYYRSSEEQRGRFLASSLAISAPEFGIPSINGALESMCSIWIAKSSAIPNMTEGLVGIMSGSSSGIVTSYSLGTIKNTREKRFDRGEITNRWVLSPGVPIIAFAVDENFSEKQRKQKRSWVAALNALGEVYHLAETPMRPAGGRIMGLDEATLERLAWETGRTVHWSLIEPTRRTARADPYTVSSIDGSYSPRSSCNEMHLSKSQIDAETKEIERFLSRRPKHFRKACEGWDMRRRLEVDFGGDDKYGTGENIIVTSCGHDEGSISSIKRFTRCSVEQMIHSTSNCETSDPYRLPTTTAASRSLFAGTSIDTLHADSSFLKDTAASRWEDDNNSSLEPNVRRTEEWRTSLLTFGELRAPIITTTAIDMSDSALSNGSEDSHLRSGNFFTVPLPSSTPMRHHTPPISRRDIPGCGARLFAAGTRTGLIVLWNVRASTAKSADLVNMVKPIRIILTDSPQITCLALTALYLVHGGNDGLVQAWDPLASSLLPIRTIHSRFSSRARRRLVQAEASAQGVGINNFAAGAICLDPDPMVLRGVVSLGTHLRYWRYSSSTADQYKSNKRRVRRSERRSNQSADHVTNTWRGALKDYIANEKIELETDMEKQRKEEERLIGRFGMGLLGPGASEEEIIAYATLLSEEALARDQQRRWSAGEDSKATPSDDAFSMSGSSFSAVNQADEEEIDTDVAEAIRLSLEEGGTTSLAHSDNTFVPDETDLDLALQLSLVEAEGSMKGVIGNFPVLQKNPRLSAAESSQSRERRHA